MILEFTDDFFTSVYFKLQEAKTRFVINYGGTGSGKSYSQAQHEIIKLISNSKGDTVCFRKVARSHRESTLKELKEKIELFELTKYFPVEVRWGGDAHEIYFPKHKRKIAFLGMDDPDKIKSLKGFQRAWCEEMNEFTEEDFFEINRRLRAMPDIQITGTFNPISKTHWIKKMFFDNSEVAKDTTIIKSTYRDNPYMSETDIKFIDMIKDLDLNQWNIYANAEWGDVGIKRPFAYGFKEKNISDNLQFDWMLPVWLSFDFNVDPITAIAGQIDDTYIKVIQEYRLIDSDIFKLCEAIKKDFAGRSVFFKITGDASGKNRSALTSGNINYYQIIRDELKVNNTQFYVPTSNNSLKNSRVLLNYMLTNFDFKINRWNEFLIDDLRTVEVNDAGDIDKTKDHRKTHLLDCLRYLVDTNYQKYLINNQLYKLKS